MRKLQSLRYHFRLPLAFAPHAVFYGEEELAKGITNHLLQRFAPQSAASGPATAERSEHA